MSLKLSQSKGKIVRLSIQNKGKPLTPKRDEKS